ncbi:uncharacterized protein BDZ99DRAFT_412911 [Mytilinidion resinicola]|uniref:Formin GTPase-binding domain-containing protein n=1 Tax=Mytilinidion resinicola TaxID=574789 RepID=A0A6A6YUT3_9PEZI|nr:uncharacterized protein BDZ99DRAFT_412911 [Mytilinidion resinicola]KAF2812308.1 hypothetical protein BDZ99DRAFT_412911 [Mytilinidion resinicola]
MVSKGHKKTPSDGTPLSIKEAHITQSYDPRSNMNAMPMLPPDHPHTQRALGQIHNPPSNPASSRKSKDTKDAKPKGLHKKTLSSVSLRSLAKDKDKEEKRHSREPSRARADKDETGSPKKNKSSTNLAAVFHKSKAPKEVNRNSHNARDKENTTPPGSAIAPEVQTPIWAQFSSQPFQEVRTTSTIPLNDRRSIEQEIALYTPTEYSPSKQRNFYDYGQPSLQKRPGAASKERPKSTFLPSTGSTSNFMETLSRKMSGERAPLSATKGNEIRGKEDTSSRGATTRGMLRRASSEGRKSMDDKPRPGQTVAQKGARVMAAVAVFNGKSKEAEVGASSPLNPKDIDEEFEAVLESRNIPEHQRVQMRSLTHDIKANFVRVHKVDAPQPTPQPAKEATTKRSLWGDAASKRPTLGRSAKSRDGSHEDEATDAADASKSASTSKRTRPRSRAFTFSKGDSPTKKQKAEGELPKSSSTKAMIPKSPSSKSLASMNGTQGSSFFSKNPKSATPDEFVAYMRKVQKPQAVEVGKMNKLRQLLRNETVEWVDGFMRQGGMTELVGLLHRIMEVEWREEHEDTLLHEVLRCLKGLCTTDLALKELCHVSSTLFPVLIAMLFDPEHKGPSEFTTRDLILSLLFAHLSSAPLADRGSRAREILSYLKDPVNEKEAQAIPFVLQMHQPRPYRVWCREISNVTKEVFWIFNHSANVVPMPKTIEDGRSYAETHFPGPRPIVAAQPYVGGVEWDSTNYLATHLDLLNGLIASLPEKEDRDALRTELKASGFEKLLGYLRACSEKYYAAVHCGLKTWVRAAVADDWDARTVRMYGGDGAMPISPKKSPKKAEKAPVIEAPNLGLGNNLGLGLDFGKDQKAKSAERDSDDWI